MIKINIFDGTDDPIQIISDNSPKEMVELMNKAYSLILLYDCKTKVTFSVPIEKYVISWEEFDD